MPLLDRLVGGPRRRRRRASRRLRDLDRLSPIDGLDVLEALDATTDWTSAPRAHRVRGAGRAVRLPRSRPRGPGEPVRILVALSATCVAVALAVHLTGDDVSLLHRLRGDHGAGVASTTGAGPYRFMAHQPGQPTTPVTYDPCRTIHVVYNPAGGPGIGEALVREAMRTLGQDTGLTFAYDGHTTRRPPSGRPDSGREEPDRPDGSAAAPYRPALVSFATVEEVPGLKGRVAGLGGSAASEDAIGHLSYRTGEVTLDSEAFRDVIRGQDGPQLARAIVLHEFGHLIGLAHVHDRHELMNKENKGLHDFGPGDLEGLAQLGRGRCT